MTDDPQGFLPPEPKPQPKQKAEEKRRIKYFGMSDSTSIITVVSGERIEEGKLVYIDYDGKAYNY